MRAVSSGDRDKVESLLRDGADLNPSPSVFKTTPLIVACGTKGSYKIACLLLEEGADPNLGNDEGWTPLMGAAKSGHYRTVGVLLEGRAHPDIHTPKGWTALMEAVDKGHGDIALRIIEAGATPHIQHKVNKTNALLLATEHDKLDRVVHALLDRMDSSSHLDLQNSEGDTALLIAFKKNKVQLVKRLLSMGANPNISNKNGETPVIIAQGEDKREILDLLQSCARPIHHSDKPTLQLLLRFPKKSGSVIEIIEHIGDKHHELGVRLLDDASGDTVCKIESQYGPEKTRFVTEAILRRWLLGAGRKPQSWTTLTTVLREIELNALAEEIEDNLDQPGEDSQPQQEHTTDRNNDSLPVAPLKQLFAGLRLILPLSASVLTVLLLLLLQTNPVLPPPPLGNISNQLIRTTHQHQLLQQDAKLLLKVDGDGKIKVSGVPILSMQAFLYNGRQVDFIWEDAGISLHIPESPYEGEIEISVAIFRTSDKYCIWSEGYRFMPPASACYKITASDTLPVPVRVRMQHCAIVEKEDSLVYLVAHGGPPFMFQPFHGGKFPTNESYGEIEITDFSWWQIFSPSTVVAIQVVYFDDSTACIVVTKNIPSDRTAVKEEYPSATEIDSYPMTCPCTTTKLAFSKADPNSHKGWGIKLLTTPAEINMNIVHGYIRHSVVPNIKVKLEWEGDGPPKEEYIQIRVKGGEDMETFPLKCSPPGRPADQYSHHSQPPHPVEELTGPQCNQIVRKLHGVDWVELANQLNLEDEIHAIAGACQQENPVACRLRQIVDRFINSQDLEPCYMTAEKIAGVLEALKYTKQADLIRSVCPSKG